MKDQHGRKVNYMRISVTDRCNYRCRYCMPSEGIKKVGHRQILRNEEIVNLVRAGTKIGINKVRLTGGEPLVRKGIVSLINDISSIEEIKDLAITTNGHLLKEYGSKLKDAGLKRLNISIDSLNEDRFREITRCGELKTVIEGLEEVKKLGFKNIKVNTVLIKGVNDNEVTPFIELAYKYDIEVRFIELMPIGDTSNWTSNKYTSNKVILDMFPNLIPIEQSVRGPSTTYELPYGRGRIGLINPISDHFCGDCNRIRITSEGRIKPCLHSDYEVDIKSELNRGHNLKQILSNSIFVKPSKHHINEHDFRPITREMYQIGG